MRIHLAALFLIVLPVTAASAGPCDDGLKAVDQALETGTVPPAQRAEARDMREQAAKLCASGNEQEGQDVLAEVRAMLGIE